MSLRCCGQPGAKYIRSSTALNETALLSTKIFERKDRPIIAILRAEILLIWNNASIVLLPKYVGANRSRPDSSTFSSCTLFHILDRTHAKVEWTVSKANEVFRKYGKYILKQ